jgi:hypothetical protein
MLTRASLRNGTIVPGGLIVPEADRGAAIHRS